MITVGLDLSLTKTGIVITQEDGSVLYSGLVRSKPTGDSVIDETRRILKIAEEVVSKIDEMLPGENPAIIAIEGLAFMARNTTALVQLAGLNYLIRVMLSELGWPFIIVAPTSLKKFITGSGKGDKDMMSMAVYKNYGFESLDNNIADAYSLSVTGLAVLDKPLRPNTIPQNEVIKLLKQQL